MRLIAVILENFRSYAKRTRIEIGDITAFIGKNDAGKSTILEALAIFFESGSVRIDSDDVSTRGDSKTIRIGCIFDDFPDSLTIDEEAETNLNDEYLLNNDGYLEIHKLFDTSASRITPKLVAVAKHPTIAGASDLLSLRHTDLKRRASELGLLTKVEDQRSNPLLRQAIWRHFSELDGLALSSVEIPLDKESAKQVWEKIGPLMPVFALFRADRPSTDNDSEVQDPMKMAVAEAIRSVEQQLEMIKVQVQEKAEAVARHTLTKLQEMDPELAKQLKPKFSSEPKWEGFKLSLVGDDNIPVNKRGSGVRRLILLNFFRAEAERKAKAEQRADVIYAIEEPEVSQHPAHIQILVKSLIELSNVSGHQVILTTHLPALAGLLPLDSLRHIVRDQDGQPAIACNDDRARMYETIAGELGILPDLAGKKDGIRLLVCVEGLNDVLFLKLCYSLLKDHEPELADIINDPRVAIIPLYGEHLKSWVENHFLRDRNIVEYHLYDRDADGKYKEACERVNSRGDGSCGFLTQRLTMESYIHPKPIGDALGVKINFPEAQFNSLNVLDLAAEQLKQNKKNPIWREVHNSDSKKVKNNIKKLIHERAVPQMTYEQLIEIDPESEVRGWFRKITEMMNQ